MRAHLRAHARAGKYCARAQPKRARSSMLQLDDEFALDLLVHGQQVGDVPVDLAQEHSHSDVSASPTSLFVCP